MQTTETTTAQRVTEIVAARKEKAAKSTMGLMIDGRPATIADLTTNQFNSAVNSVKFSFKSTARQQRLDLVTDCVADAVAEIVAGTHVWDSAKGSFYTCLRTRVAYLLKAQFSKTAYKREADSYSQASNGDGEAVEFNYATAEIQPDAILEKNEKMAQIKALTDGLTMRERIYLKLATEAVTVPEKNKLEEFGILTADVFIQGEIGQMMGMLPGTYRKFKFDFEAKNALRFANLKKK